MIRLSGTADEKHAPSSIREYLAKSSTCISTAGWGRSEIPRVSALPSKHYRALAVREGDVVGWFWIGTRRGIQSVPVLNLFSCRAPSVRESRYPWCIAAIPALTPAPRHAAAPSAHAACGSGLAALFRQDGMAQWPPSETHPDSRQCLWVGCTDFAWRCILSGLRTRVPGFARR
jgi:hypothetical protein